MPGLSLDRFDAALASGLYTSASGTSCWQCHPWSYNTLPPLAAVSLLSLFNVNFRIRVTVT